jgi:hypothetical protein
VPILCGLNLSLLTCHPRVQQHLASLLDVCAPPPHSIGCCCWPAICDVCCAAWTSAGFDAGREFADRLSNTKETQDTHAHSRSYHIPSHHLTLPIVGSASEPAILAITVYPAIQTHVSMSAQMRNLCRVLLLDRVRVSVVGRGRACNDAHPAPNIPTTCHPPHSRTLTDSPSSPHRSRAETPDPSEGIIETIRRDSHSRGAGREVADSPMRR